MSAEECAFFIRRLEHDPAERDRLIRYTRIRAALRGELLSPDPDVLRRRVQESLSGISIPPARSATGRRPAGKLLKPAMGFGIAATVAVAAVVTLRFMSQGGLEAGTSGAEQSLQSAAGTEVPSYVVPPEVEPRRLVSPPTRLANYLIRHSEYANRVRRASFDSDLVGTVDAELAAAAEGGSE